MPFIQSIKPILIEKTGNQRLSDLKIEDCDLSEPRYLTERELLDYDVQPDFEHAEFFRLISHGSNYNENKYRDREQDKFMERFFDAPYGHTYQNSVDHVAIKLDRGDAVLSISALKLFEEGIGLVSHDYHIEMICAKNSYIACVNQEWIGGDAYSTLFIDFTGDVPIFVKVFNEFDFGRINGIATLSNGVTVVLLYGGNDEIFVLNCEQFSLGEYAEGQTLELAIEAFSQLPKAW